MLFLRPILPMRLIRINSSDALKIFKKYVTILSLHWFMENVFEKNSPKQEIVMAFVYSRQRKRKARTFHLEDNNGKLWVEVIIVTFFGCISERICPHIKQKCRKSSSSLSACKDGGYWEKGLLSSLSMKSHQFHPMAVGVRIPEWSLHWVGKLKFLYPVVATDISLSADSTEY